MTIECVTISTNHHFEGNPLADQHRLRYRSLIERQSWGVPSFNGMEYDQYDNPATVYFVWRLNGVVRGVARLYPTTRPYMLKEVFRNLKTYEPLPSSPQVWEGSRFCIDKSLTSAQRKRVIQELVLAYLEYCISHKIDSVIGIMVPAYWKNIFIKNDCPVSWLGGVAKAKDKKNIRPGKIIVDNDVLKNVREKTGIYEDIISYGASCMS